MLIQSQVNRAYWRNTLLAFAPDSLIAGVVAVVLDQGWLFFVVVYIGLEVAYLLVWLRQSLWGWALFFLFGRKELTRGVLAELREQKFPEPPNLIIDVDEYFLEVAQNKEVADETRVRAAINVGFLQYPKSMRHVQTALKMHLALEDAIHAYKAGFTAIERSASS